MFLRCGEGQLDRGKRKGAKASPEPRSNAFALGYRIEQTADNLQSPTRAHMTGRLQIPPERDGKTCAGEGACQFGSITSQRDLRAVPHRSTV
jgi:hypothetical protein